MVEEQFFYSTLNERRTILNREHVKGKSLIHDDFVDSQGRPTDGKSGRLTIDTIPNTPDPTYTRLKELQQKILDNESAIIKMTPQEIVEYLRLSTNLTSSRVQSSSIPIFGTVKPKLSWIDKIKRMFGVK